MGYQGRTLDELLDVLAAAGVTRVVDVRELPWSRKPGFSRTALDEGLASRGIEYVHVRAAGNPFRASPGGTAHVLARYREHVRAHPEAIDALEHALAGARAALLCYERDPNACHRSVLVDELLARRRRSVLHLE